MTLRLADHCGLYLSELATADERIWALDGDLADSDGAIHFAEKHPQRFIMAGIAEQSMVSIAAGMASCGLRPWVFSFGAFLCYRAYDQIRVCLSHARQSVTLVGSHTGGCTARNGKTHAALNDVALMASLPGMQVWSPCGPEDLKYVMDNILLAGSPTYLRFPRRPLAALPGEPSLCRWLDGPQRVTLLSTGLGTHLAWAARQILLQQGLPVAVLHCPRIVPLPETDLLKAIQQVESLFVIEDHYDFGGLASLIQHLCPQRKIISIGWQMGWPGKSGRDNEMLRLGKLAPDQIAATVLAAVTRSSETTLGKVCSYEQHKSFPSPTIGR